MANITLHSDSQTSATSVSNIFIDEYMSDANGEFVKIYLYLLRSSVKLRSAMAELTAMPVFADHSTEVLHIFRLKYQIA